MIAKPSCDKLEELNREAISAFLEARKIRIARDVSIFEDADLCREQSRRIYALIRHLLVGHQGKACPAGEQPIVKDSGLLRRR
jgi:hypothetical protein